MIYPTRLAILAAVAGAPVTLLVALLVPGRWQVALAWPAALLIAVVADALTGAMPRAAKAGVKLPASASVGSQVEAVVQADVSGIAPGEVEIAISGDPLLTNDTEAGAWIALENGQGAAVLPLTAIRRGTARIERVWIRWKGRLGLVWKQRSFAANASVAILPDIRPVHDKGALLFQRYALHGLLTQFNRGDGTDFDALVEYRQGMDRRAIDWKQSARHLKLHAKEFRTERNNQIVFAVDAGRQMAEPVAGLTRLDRVVGAMLLNAWVALKLGDRVALHAFDSRPRIASGFVSGAGGFAELQRLAARIDYGAEESNYTFALTTLASQLNRRSLIVLFTEFTDLTSAEFMVRAAARLVETHLLLVVVLRDEELEGIVDKVPESADDVTRAVTASALLRDRLEVLVKLRHLGAHVIEAEYDRVGERLVAGYTDLKRRNLL